MVIPLIHWLFSLHFLSPLTDLIVYFCVTKSSNCLLTLDMREERGRIVANGVVYFIISCTCVYEESVCAIDLLLCLVKAFLCMH